MEREDKSEREKQTTWVCDAGSKEVVMAERKANLFRKCGFPREKQRGSSSYP